MVNDFDIQKARSDLKALRDKHDADTAVGHRCSNLMEQLENYESAVVCENRPARDALEKSIGRQLADLAKLTAGG